MSNQDPVPQPHTGQPDDQQQWGVTRLIHGRQCRQCRRCGDWFHVGSLADHGCPVKRQLRLFDPPE